MTDPDFEQIARGFIEALGIERLDEWDGDTSQRVAVAFVAELRQVWNARGAADLAKVEEELTGTMMGPGTLSRAIKALDR